MLLLICIIGLIIFILDTKTKIEQFKNKQYYISKYLNDPKKLAKYKAKRSIKSKKLQSSTYTSSDQIQSNNVTNNETNNKTNNETNNEINQIIEIAKTYSPVNFKPALNNSLSETQLDINNFNKCIDQSNNKSINKSNNKSNNKSINKSINESINKSIDQLNNNNNKSAKKLMVKFNPTINQFESKYQTYANALFVSQPSKKIPNKSTSKSNIDQTINKNIMNFINHGHIVEPEYDQLSGKDIMSNNITNFDYIQSKEFDLSNNITRSKLANDAYPTFPIDMTALAKLEYANDMYDINLFKDKKLTSTETATSMSMNAEKIKSMTGQTIKQIYDEITNDNRLNLQQNLDNLEAYTNRSDFIIGEKYGATRFDTYSVN